MRGVIIFIVLVTSLLALPEEFDREQYNRGEKVFDNKCSKCHEKSKDYLYSPDLSKTICLEGVIRHFDVMPSMKGKISQEEIEDVNHFLYFLQGFNGVNEYYHNEAEF